MPRGFFSCLRWCVSFKVLWWRSLLCVTERRSWDRLFHTSHLCWRTSFNIVGVRMWNSLIGRKCRYCETQIENLDIRSHSVKSLEHYNRCGYLAFNDWVYTNLVPETNHRYHFHCLDSSCAVLKLQQFFRKAETAAAPNNHYYVNRISKFEVGLAHHIVFTARW